MQRENMSWHAAANSHQAKDYRNVVSRRVKNQQQHSYLSAHAINICENVRLFEEKR